MIRITVALIVFGFLALSPGARALGSPFMQGLDKKADPKTPAPSARPIVDEIQADLEKARERLSNDDAGAETRTAQQRILDNIDRLLKQQDPSSNSSPPSRPKPNGETKPASKPEAVDPKPSPVKPEATKPQEANEPKPAQTASKTTRTGEAKENVPPNTINDLKKVNHAGEWKLPSRLRQEMDAFGRERFIPQYEEMLRAYYRSLAESSRRE